MLFINQRKIKKQKKPYASKK